jgi:DNA-binding XRE family transcriptional regulator
VLTFSEWQEQNASREPAFVRNGKSTLPRQVWTVEVPYERPKRYVEHPKTLAEHIRKKRIESGLTQKGLGVLLEVAECTIYNWERSVGPRESLRTRVLAYLNVSPMLQSRKPDS